MARILLIETSTALCSVALETDGKIIASRRSDENRSHASLTAVFCDEVLKEHGLKAGDLDAVCISEGPGSYTGLRVGLSTAKGLCFGAGIRMLSVCSLDILAMQAAASVPNVAHAGISHIIPMTDARRMEVYTAVYDACGKEFSIGNTLINIPERQTAVLAKVIDSEAIDADWTGEDDSMLTGSFILNDIAKDSIFIGDGALKCKEVIKEGRFIEAFPEATAMAVLAEREFSEGNWRDIAYFEPFYLKEFVATTSKKKLF